MIKYLIEKEFKQLFRNSFLPKLIFIFPCMIMILMPWAANLEMSSIMTVALCPAIWWISSALPLISV